MRFCQPGNRPSKVSYSNAQIRSSGIMSTVVRNLYSIKKSRDKLGLLDLARKDGHRIISDIDSSMNAWMNSVPDHCMPFALSVQRNTDYVLVRWDPTATIRYSCINRRFYIALIICSKYIRIDPFYVRAPPCPRRLSLCLRWQPGLVLESYRTI